MRPETFLEKFDLIADAPGAVAKMRELILEMAVTGKLVSQENSDEPASLLLESAKRERAQLVTSKKIKFRAFSPVGEDAQQFDAPPGWAWASLSDVGHELGQKVPDKHFTYIDVGGIDSEKGIISDRVEKLEPNSAPSRARKLVRLGTVIYSTVRPYLLNIAIVDKGYDPEPIASTAFGILHPFEGINNRYLFYWLRSAAFTAYVQASMKGMAYPAINDEKFYSGPIALPPLAEQKRIVAKVDELMALCDRLEQQQKEREAKHAALSRASLTRFSEAPTTENLNLLFHPSYTTTPNELRKTILTLAVQGKLVPQDPSDEPAEEILARIQTISLTKSPLKSPAIQQELDELSFNLPNGWATSRLGSILLPTRGISYGVIKLGPEPQQGGVFILRCSNVRFRRIDLNGIRKITEQLSSEYGRTILEGGEVLINVRGTLGGCAVVPPALKGYNIAREVAVIPVHNEIDPSFLLNVIASPFFQDRIDENLRGIAYEGLNLGLLRDFLVPIPPLAEQKRIVAKVDELMKLVDQLEEQLTTARTTAENLLNALLADLTSQKAA